LNYSPEVNKKTELGTQLVSRLSLGSVNNLIPTWTQGQSYKKEECPKRNLCVEALDWLGWLDSNQRITESKSVALPLGDTPILIF
jgi:hypothetical protein